MTTGETQNTAQNLRPEPSQQPEALPACPVCQQSDQVKPLQAVYGRGSERIATAARPRRTKALLPWLLLAAVIYLAAQFYLLVQMGGPAGFQNWPIWGQILEVALLIGAATAFIWLSMFAFRNWLDAVREERQVVPTRDPKGHALDPNLRRLYYCQRDDVVFDEQRQLVPKEAALKEVLGH